MVGSAFLEYVGGDHYYLKDIDQEAILRIDGDGKIVNVISRQGRGSGEYLRADVVDVNEKNSTIRIFNQSGDKYITYDMSGNLISEGSLSDKGVALSRFISDDYMVMRGRRENIYRLHIADRDLNIQQSLFPMDASLSAIEREMMLSQVGTGSDGDAALVNIATEDTLYRVTNRGVIPEAILEKGRYRLTGEAAFSLVGFDPSLPQFFRNTSVSLFGDYYFIHHLMDRGRAMDIWNKTNSELVAHTDNRNGYDNFGFRFTFPAGGETIVSSFYIDGDKIGFVVDAIDAVGWIDGVKEDDNPVIVIARIKQ